MLVGGVAVWEITWLAAVRFRATFHSNSHKESSPSWPRETCLSLGRAVSFAERRTGFLLQLGTCTRKPEASRLGAES